MRKVPKDVDAGKTLTSAQFTKEMERTAEDIACGIASISRSMKTLLNSRLKREAIVTLLHARSASVGKRDIEFILNNLETLEETWLKKAQA